MKKLEMLDAIIAGGILITSITSFVVLDKIYKAELNKANELEEKMEMFCNEIIDTIKRC